MDYTFENLRHFIDILMPRLRIAVIFGGNKNSDDATIFATHNPRPWKSYESVAENIRDALIGIGFKNVITMPDNMQMPGRLRDEHIHFAWLNTGGVQGYNPVAHTPSILEMLGIPYVGHNPLTSTLLDNKHCFKRELNGLGIPTAPFMVWDMTKGMLYPHTNFRFRRAFGNYRGPFVVKPITGRASLHIHIVDDIQSLSETVKEVYESTHNHVLVERFLSGREYCVSVCGKTISRKGKLELHQMPFVFSEIERLYDEGERMFTSMDVKPITGKRARMLDDIEDAYEIEQLHSLAQKIYLDFDLRTLIRLDIRSDENNNMYVLEANPKPDLKRFQDNVVSLVAMGLQKCDLSYEDLILSLLADRLNHILQNQSAQVGHIISLLD